MANIQTFLEKILSARYGKDVRQSIHDAIVEIDSVADTAQTSATAQAEAARKSAQTAESKAQASATSEANAKTYMESAKTSEENAKVSETNSKVSENNTKESENNAKLTEERAREVFESIPEDYSTISNDLYELAIKETASGEEIHVNDSSNVKLREFALYGKAEQNGEPTPENPIEIEVSGASGSVAVTSSNEYNTKTTTAIIPTPNGLAGIKVSSKGNYTDQNGQQWVCDEIVRYADGSGKYVQRIDRVVSNPNGSLENLSPYTGVLKDVLNFRINRLINTIGKNTPILCDKLVSKSNWRVNEETAWAVESTGIDCAIRYDRLGVTSDIAEAERIPAVRAWLVNNELTFYYILATPIETPLTAEEIAEIEKLHTFYPITNISNDFDCGMKVTYYCDSKNYIDKKISELATAMVNNI